MTTSNNHVANWTDNGVMTMTNPGCGAAFAEVADQLSRYQDSLRERDETLRQVTEIRTEFASADKGVQVAVNSEGFLLGLQLAPSVSGMPAGEIADLILHVYNAAQQAAAAQAAELIQSSVGGTGGSIAEKYRSRLVQATPPVPQAPTAESEPSDHEYNADYSPPPSWPGH